MILYTTTRELLTHGDLGDFRYNQANDELGAEALVELTAIVGYYSWVAMTLKVFKVTSPKPGEGDRTMGCCTMQRTRGAFV